jgi:hypothetical protein
MYTAGDHGARPQIGTQMVTCIMPESAESNRAPHLHENISRPDGWEESDEEVTLQHSSLHAFRTEENAQCCKSG